MNALGITTVLLCALIVVITSTLTQDVEKALKEIDKIESYSSPRVSPVISTEVKGINEYKAVIKIPMNVDIEGRISEDALKRELLMKMSDNLIAEMDILKETKYETMENLYRGRLIVVRGGKKRNE